MSIRIAICDNKDCPKSNSCKRFLDKTGEPMNMPAICYEENNYIHYWYEDKEGEKCNLVK